MGRNLDGFKSFKLKVPAAGDPDGIKANATSSAAWSR
jgi:hypothetical protein